MEPRKDLQLRIPDRGDFVTRQTWLADPEFMSYNAGWDISHPGYDRQSGCISWPESEWDAFQQRLDLPLGQCGYFFVESVPDHETLGHIHYTVTGTVAEIGFNVVPRHRGEGLGHQFLSMLIDAVRDLTVATEITNEFEDTRTPAVRTHRRAGFTPDAHTTSEFGRPVRTWRLPVDRGASGTAGPAGQHGLSR